MNRTDSPRLDLSRNGTNVRRSAACWALVAALALLLLPASGAALVAPMTVVDGARFPVETEQIRAANAIIRIAPDPESQQLHIWWVDVEVTLRSAATVPIDVELAILDERATTDATQVWIDGAAVSSDVITPRQAPDLRGHTWDHARRVRVHLALGGEVVVRARMRRSGVLDTLGRVQLELPTHGLGLFADAVTAGSVRVDTGGRPVGFQATIDGGVVYGAPLDEVSWAVRQWEPGIPFAVSWWTPWSALLVVAEVEACPAPWRVVRATTQSEIAGLRAMLDPFDDATLRFCASLPEVLRGKVYESARTVEQLSAMTLERYVPGGGVTQLYVPDEAYDEATMTEAEAIYLRALRAALDARGLQPLGASR